MKEFLSKNFISILVVIFILLGVIRSGYLDAFLTPSEKPLQKGDFFVHNHTAIHSLYYQGDFTPIDLRAIATYMDQLGEFKINQPAVLGLIKSNSSIKVMRATSEQYRDELPEKYLTVYSQVASSIKRNLYPDLSVSLVFTDVDWNPRQSFEEKDIMAKVADVSPGNSGYNPGNSQGNEMQSTTPTEVEGGDQIQQILGRWMTGATKLSQAKYYFPVQENDSWRIYYSDIVSEQVSSLAQVLLEGNFFQKDFSNFIAFYTLADPSYFNGEASYVVAFPFPEDQLNDGRASQTIKVVKDFLKKGYFREANLLILATDYDFEPVLLVY